MTRGSIEEFLYNTSKKRLGKVSVRLPVLWEAFRSLRGASYHGGAELILQSLKRELPDWVK